MEITSYKYSIPYVLFLLFLAVFMFIEFRQIEKKQSIKYIRYIVIISFSSFFGLKGFVGMDAFNYYNLFNNLPTIWNWDTDTFFYTTHEILFKYYIVIIKSICPNFFFFSFVNVLIDALILDVIIRRYSRYYVLAFIIYTGIYGLIFAMDQVRNAKAVMLFLLSLKYVSEKRFSLYLIINLIGVLFHYSAIVYILLYPFLRKKHSMFFYLTVYIIGLFIFFSRIEFLNPIVSYISSLFGGRIELKAITYLNSEEYGERRYGISFGTMERFISYPLFCFLLKKKLIDKDPNSIIAINLYVLYFATYYFLAEISVLAQRISVLFIIAYAFLYPNILKIIKIDKYILLFILIGFSCIKIAGHTKYLPYTYESFRFNYEERYRIHKTWDNYLENKYKVKKYLLN